MELNEVSHSSHLIDVFIIFGTQEAIRINNLKGVSYFILSVIEILKTIKEQ